MQLENHHLILAAGTDLAACQKQIVRFFSRNLLVRYEVVEMNSSWTAADPRFWEKVEEAIAANHQIVAELFAELAEAGYESTAELVRLPQGYPSKLLHTASHLLDGFFGIDSHFYNLAEDSHGVSEPLRKKIAEQPDSYWLCLVEGRSQSRETADGVSTLRSNSFSCPE